ncbi:hypothetical protein ACHAPJ_012437 [Fusarium lateritium]
MDSDPGHLGQAIRLMAPSMLRDTSGLVTNMGDTYSTLGKSNEDEFDDYLTDRLSRMVYGSNMIEMAGGSLDTTLQLCVPIFRGAQISEEDIAEMDPEYENLRLHLQSRNIPSGHGMILKSYREIVQHAEAARYMIEQVCIQDKDLSERIIKATHGILTYKIDINEQTPWIYYSGEYRTWNVRCGSHVFMDETQVPFAMRDMIESLESDIQEATEKGEIDSVLLASKYCHRFVNIHPFGDGNGRMCRLILNTLLLKYGRGIVCIGQDEADRQEYLRIAVNASAVEASQNQQNAIMENHRELALFTLRRARGWTLEKNPE